METDSSSRRAFVRDIGSSTIGGVLTFGITEWFKQEAVAELQKKIEGQATEISGLKDQVRQQGQQITNLQVEKERSNRSAPINPLPAPAPKSDVEQQLVKASTTIAQLRDDAEKNKQEIATVNQARSGLQKRHDAQSEILKAERTKVGKLEQEKLALAGEAEELRAHLERARAEAEQLRRELAAVRKYVQPQGPPVMGRPRENGSIW